MAEEETSTGTVPAETAPESSGIYRIITRFWPRIAAGSVAVVGVAEWVIEGLTSGGALELFVFTWAAVTATLWFLFDKAERGLGEESRRKVAGWIQNRDFRGSVEAFPEQFTSLFDRVFGEKHLSLKCFGRSTLASVTAAISAATALSLIFLDRLLVEFGGPDVSWWMIPVGVLPFFVINVFPDYLSLLETRWMMRFAKDSLRRVVGVLGLDLIITGSIAFLFWLGISVLVEGSLMMLYPETGPEPGRFVISLLVSMNFALLVCLASTFFTSGWLWLYGASVFGSRVLLRIGKGAGFLLKASDVERQPFRSMGFTSVVIVSALFLVILPFLLLV